jgi:hypothetical protein
MRIKDKPSVGPTRRKALGCLLHALAWLVLLSGPIALFFLCGLAEKLGQKGHYPKYYGIIVFMLGMLFVFVATYVVNKIAKKAGWDGSKRLGHAWALMANSWRADGHWSIGLYRWWADGHSGRNTGLFWGNTGLFWEGVAEYIKWLLGLAAWLFLLGSKAKARTAKDLESDPRSPILLLRAFTDDEYPVGAKRHALGLITVVEMFEEVIAETCERFGPVIAIGRPGETMSPLGAARMWIPDSKWKSKVIDLLHECRYVVMIMGAIQEGDGLSWEIKQIIDSGFLHKTILVMPPIDDSQTASRWERYRRLIPAKIPVGQGGELIATFNTKKQCEVYRIGWGNVDREQKDKNSYQVLLRRAIKSKQEPRRRKSDGH